jgi:hypothetical protein
MASKVALGVKDWCDQTRSEVQARVRAGRHLWARLQHWADMQHVTPDQVLQLGILVIYCLLSIAEAFGRRGRR